MARDGVEYGSSKWVFCCDIRAEVAIWCAGRGELRYDPIVWNLSQFKAAIHKAVPEMPFETDTYLSSIALTAGYDSLRWGKRADFASLMVSHTSAFVCNTFVEWAQFLQEEIQHKEFIATGLPNSGLLRYGVA